MVALIMAKFSFLPVFAFLAVFALLLVSCTGEPAPQEDAEAASLPPLEEFEGEWVSLFDGKTLNGWQVNENKETFSIEDGTIKVAGLRSHLFYMGSVGDHDFKNFEFKADVMTMPGSNSGMYIHTEFLEEGWPEKGYEIQVNNTHGDPKKTGGLYAIADVIDNSPAKDNEWFTQHILVKDNWIQIRVNGEVTTDYEEPENLLRPDNMRRRKLSSGTVALQGHDPESVIYYKNIMVKIIE